MGTPKLNIIVVVVVVVVAVAVALVIVFVIVIVIVIVIIIRSQKSGVKNRLFEYIHIRTAWSCHWTL